MLLVSAARHKSCAQASRRAFCGGAVQTRPSPPTKRVIAQCAERRRPSVLRRALRPQFLVPVPTCCNSLAHPQPSPLVCLSDTASRAGTRHSVGSLSYSCPVQMARSAWMLLKRRRIRISRPVATLKRILERLGSAPRALLSHAGLVG